MKGALRKKHPFVKGVPQKTTPLREGAPQKETPLREGAPQKETPLREGVPQKETPLREGVLKGLTVDQNVSTFMGIYFRKYYYIIMFTETACYCTYGPLSLPFGVRGTHTHSMCVGESRLDLPCGRYVDLYLFIYCVCVPVDWLLIRFI